MISSFFKNKSILITGGTGSIGSEVLQRLTTLPVKNIIIFSRDEYKHYQLRYQYRSSPVQIDYILGDVRDQEAIMFASRNTDILFHCSAYKHVPQSEEMPEEFIKTNVLGSINVKKAALSNHISTVISISSDKAVNPSNTMGLTKALQEKIFSSLSLQRDIDHNQRFINVRFGNVIGTKGSLFPIFFHQINNKEPLTITDPAMTRFFMTKTEAIDLIFWGAMHGQNGQTVIKKMKAVNIEMLAQQFLTVLKQKDSYPIKYIGLRVGEKMHESLIIDDEFFKVKQNSEYYLIDPYKDVEVEKNIMLNSLKKNRPFTKEDFSSENPSNRMNQTMISKIVKTYIDEAKKKHDYI